MPSRLAVERHPRPSALAKAGVSGWAHDGAGREGRPWPTHDTDGVHREPNRRTEPALIDVNRVAAFPEPLGTALGIVTRMQRILLILAIVLIAGLASADPPPANAADAYRRAITWFDEAWRPHSAGNGPNESRRDDLQLINDWAFRRQSPTPEVRAAFERIRPALDMAREATSATRCDFELDRSRGFELAIPHLMPMRALGRLMSAEAILAMEDGDWERATQTIASASRLARHAQNDGLVVSSLVSAAILTMPDERLGDLEASGQLDAEAATRLLGELDTFDAVDPLNLAFAFSNEGVMAQASIEGVLAKHPADAGAKLAELFGAEGSEGTDPIAKLSADDLRGQLDRTDALYREFASLARSTDPAARSARVAELEDEIREGKHGELAQLVMPSAARIFDASDRTRGLLAARMKTLRAIRDGADPASFADAGPHYRMLAKLVLGVDPEAQRIVELVRLSPSLVDPETRVLAERALAPLRDSLAELFRSAAACDRCRWRSPREYEIRLLPDEVTSLRAAARLARADALLRATAPASERRPETPTPPLSLAESFEVSLALVRHLGMDPSFSQSIVAESIARELASDLRDARAAKHLDEKSLVRLSERVAALDRADPFSFRAGIAADADRFLLIYLGFGSDRDAERQPARATLLKAPADSFSLVCLGQEIRFLMNPVLNVPVDATEEQAAELRAAANAGALAQLIARRDTGALLGWSDLVPGDLAALAKTAERFLFDQVTTLIAGESLPSPPFPLGLTDRMNGAMATIAALDDGVDTKAEPQAK